MLLAAAAVVLAAAMGVTGATELVLYGGPLLFIAGLLLSGRFIGEERILARRAAPAPRLRAERQALGAPARAPARGAARAQPAPAARPARARGRLIPA